MEPENLFCDNTSKWIHTGKGCNVSGLRAAPWQVKCDKRITAEPAKLALPKVKYSKNRKGSDKHSECCVSNFIFL